MCDKTPRNHNVADRFKSPSVTALQLRATDCECFSHAPQPFYYTASQNAASGLFAEPSQVRSIDRMPSNTSTKWLQDSDFRQMVEDLQVMVCVYDINGYIYLNPATEIVTGYSLEEIRHQKFWEVVHPDDRVWIKSRGIARLRGEKVPATREFRIIKKNGEVMWINVFYLITTWSGRNVNILGFTDITENKRLSEDLRVSRADLELRVEQRTRELNRTNKDLIILNQNLNNILNNISDGVATINDSGEVQLLNPFFKRMSEQTATEIKSILKNMILNKTDGSLHRMFREKKSFRDEEMIFQVSEGALSLLVSGTPNFDEKGQMHSAVIIFRPMKDVHRLVQRFSGFMASFCFEDIVTVDPIMTTLIDNAKHTALSDSSVMIEGESGTGKELFAQAIHNYSLRNDGPFVAINCGATPRELIASELFGYAEGAFTGAKKNGNPGKFELASGGTLFLDEIGDMPLEQQSSLLRILQEKKITRIGGCHAIPTDVRIICATNKDLYQEMKKGSFRNDLYYRLNVINIKIPPLRERRPDIMLLIDHFMKNKENRSGERRIQVSGQVLECLMHYDWPGNVRELQNVIERLSSMISGTSVTTDHLPPEIRAFLQSPQLPSSDAGTPGEPDSMHLLKAERNGFRRKSEEEQIKRIISLLAINRWNISSVARELGISRTTLYKKIRRAGIN